jgi:hypothetical protein
MFECHRVAIDPATFCGRMDHGVLAAHVVRRDWHIDPPSDISDDVEVGDSGLDHHHIGTLIDIKIDLTERFTDVARILLVTLPVAAVCYLDVDRVSKRPVQRARVLRRVRKDRHVEESGIIECGADRSDLAVHHPARGDDVRACRCLGDGGLRVDGKRGVVVDVAGGVDDSAVPVIGVFVDAQICHQHDLIAVVGCEIGERALNDSVRIESPTPNCIFVGRDAEEDHRFDAQTNEVVDLGAQRGSRVLHDARQRLDRLGFVDVLTHEERSNQVIDTKVHLGDERTHRCRTAKASGSHDRSTDRIHDRRMAVSAHPPEPTTASPRPRCASRKPIAVASWTSASRFTIVAVQAWFSSDSVDIDPGDEITLKLSIQNLGKATDSYTIVPAGLTADWIRVGRGNITLFGGASDVIDVTIAAPRLPTTTAGPTGVGVRIIPTESPDDTIVAETTLDVQPFDDRRILALQPVIRSRHRANYEFMVENHGNGLASCRLRLIDPTDRIDGNFDPPAVGVAPGGASLVRLKARARRGAFRRATRTLDFEVEAEQQGHEPSATSMSLVQPKTVPTDFITKLAAVAATLGLVALGWFFVVRPEIRDAAQDKVDDRIAEFDQQNNPVTETDEENPTATTVVGNAAGNTEVGDPAEVRLASTPAQLETLDASYTVPEGESFDLTDIRVENSNNDLGRATLLVNGEVRYIWSLANIRGSFFEPSLTPTRLAAGDNLTLSVACNTIGDNALGTCLVAVNLGGRTIVDG